MRGRYEPIVLTAAITGGDVFKSQSPAIPAGAEAIIAEAVGAADAGAACIRRGAGADLDDPGRAGDVLRVEDDATFLLDVGA